MRIRKTNIELLRILCMLLLIAHHGAVHGGPFENILMKGVTTLFVPVGKMAFDAFLAISAWFMIEASFKAERFWKIWFEVLFYNVLLTGMAFVLDSGGETGIRQLVGSIFPIMGNSHGYASSYLLFLLLIPFLQLIIKYCSQKQIVFLTIVLYATQVLSVAIGKIISFPSLLNSLPCFFILMFFLAYILKNIIRPIEKVGIKKLRYICIAVIVVSYSIELACLLIRHFIPVFPWNKMVNLIHEENSFFNIASGFSLFLLVKDLDIKDSKYINAVAGTTFGILLFHDNNCLRKVFWRIVGLNTGGGCGGLLHPLVKYFLAIAAIFLSGMCIDFLRKFLLEDAIRKSALFRRLCCRLNRIYRDSESSCGSKGGEFHE